MTKINLDELERVAKDADDGAWYQDEGDRAVQSMYPNDGVPGLVATTTVLADACFIAAANPKAILALIARIRKLEAVAEQSQSLLAMLAPDGFMRRGGDDGGYGQEMISAWRAAVEIVTTILAALDAKEET